MFCVHREKQMEYMDLAKTYLECGEPNLALKCLFHAKEYLLSAQLCEKLGKVSKDFSPVSILGENTPTKRQVSY